MDKQELEGLIMAVIFVVLGFATITILHLIN
jgi:hypothetical protein